MISFFYNSVCDIFHQNEVSNIKLRQRGTNNTMI